MYSEFEKIKGQGCFSTNECWEFMKGTMISAAEEVCLMRTRETQGNSVSAAVRRSFCLGNGLKRELVNHGRGTKSTDSMQRK